MPKIDTKFTDNGLDNNSTVRGGIVFDYTIEIEPEYRHNQLARDRADDYIEKAVARAMFDWVVENVPGAMRSWYVEQRREEYAKTGR